MMAESSEIRGITWRHEETITLISVWSDERVQLGLNSQRKNSTVFESISQKMKTAGYARNAQQCRSKIKKLTTKYHEAKKNNKKSGSGRGDFIYFEQMDQVLHDKPSSCPPYSIDTSRDAVISVESIEEFKGRFIVLF